MLARWDVNQPTKRPAAPGVACRDLRRAPQHTTAHTGVAGRAARIGEGTSATLHLPSLAVMTTDPQREIREIRFCEESLSVTKCTIHRRRLTFVIVYRFRAGCDMEQSVTYAGADGSWPGHLAYLMKSVTHKCTSFEKFSKLLNTFRNFDRFQAKGFENFSKP